MSDSLYLGIDVGTQSTKVLLVDVEGREILARAARAYPLIAGLPPGAAEQHPDTWIDALCGAVREIAATHGKDLARVAAIGVSGQQHGFVPLSEDLSVLRPAKLWCDTSTIDEARDLSAALRRPVPVGYTASKILWLKHHEPANFGKLAHVLLPHDYVNLELTGELTMEAGDASGTGFFDPVLRAFDREAMRAIDPAIESMLPNLIGPSDPAGTLKPTMAERLGLRPGIVVSCGGGDNMMSAIGSGATKDGVVVVSLGTSGTVFAHSSRPVIDDAGLIAPFCDSTGGYLPLLCVMNATGVTEEVRIAFSTPSNPLDHATLTEEAAAIAPGCLGVTWLPFLNGERVPDLPGATGTLLGLRPGSLRRGVLYRAAIEGVAFNLGRGVERMKRLGLEVARVRLVGGAARNPLWQTILSAALGVPLEVLAEPESAALGAAIQACFAHRRRSGASISISDLAEPLARVSGTAIMPSTEAIAVHRELKERFASALARLHPEA